MGLLNRIVGGKKAVVTKAVEAPLCPHSVLMPRWDTAADIGEERASAYVCEACGDKFTPQETRGLRETTAARRREARGES